jgi:uncharacterized PurR-regulated membrane protein YhhQ (DUF165 family)
MKNRLLNSTLYTNVSNNVVFKAVIFYEKALVELWIKYIPLYSEYLFKFRVKILKIPDGSRHNPSIRFWRG